MIVSGEVWLGLEKLHQLTSARDYKLQVKMKDWDDRTYIAVYDQFEVFDNPIQNTKQLDPVGSTVRYMMRKLCTGSV